MNDFDVFLPPFEVEERISLRSETERPYSWGVDFLMVKDVAPDGKGVIAFVVDTEDGGINHPAVNDFVERDYCRRFTNEPPSRETAHEHGLHVADTVLQVAPGSRVAFIKVLSNEGGGYSSDVAEGIRFVADLELKPEHAGFTKIINLSLGSNSTSPTIKSAIEYARSKGVEVFAAAGNDAKDVDFPGAFAELVITIGAIDESSRPASFSSPGPAVDLACPGERIVAAYKGSYAALSGTSMATPHAVGVAARVYAQTRDLEGFLKKYATDIHQEGRDDKTGYGVPFATNYFGELPEPEPQPDPQPVFPTWAYYVVGGIVLLAVLLFALR